MPALATNSRWAGPQEPDRNPEAGLCSIPALHPSPNAAQTCGGREPLVEVTGGHCARALGGGSQRAAGSGRRSYHTALPGCTVPLLLQDTVSFVCLVRSGNSSDLSGRVRTAGHGLNFNRNREGGIFRDPEASRWWTHHPSQVSEGSHPQCSTEDPEATAG